MHDIIVAVINLFESLMRTTGYFGLFLGTFSESFFVPIPSEILMGLAGNLISKGEWNWPMVMIAAVAGNVISTAIVWKLGHKYGEGFLLKYGSYVGYDEEELDQAKRLFDRWGYGVIFVCQLMPVMRSVITVPAGVLKTKLLPTLIATGSGATIWLALWTFVGVQLGSNYKQVEELAKPYEKPLTIVILAFFVFYVYHHFYKVIKKRKIKAN
jgi:membrane protein DedA with SNARE-associated domain